MELEPYPVPKKKCIPYWQILWKNWTQKSENVVNCTSHMKYNVELILFDIKRKGVQGLFSAKNVWKVYHKFLFLKRRIWYQSHNWHFVALTNMKRFLLVKHFCETFLTKVCFLKKKILITVSKNLIKNGCVT